MSKISELSDGGSLLASDYLLVVRSGGNVKVRMDQINVDQVDLGDNEFIRLGNSQDLTMVHTSTQSIINQAGIGDLLLQKAGATKLTINSTGIDVTGSVTADSLGIGTSSPSSYPVAPNLVVDAGTDGGITIKTGSSNYGGVYFADGTTGDEQYRGFIQYNHDHAGSTDSLLLGTAGAEKMRIDAGGNVGIGTGTPSVPLHVENSASTSEVLRLGSSTVTHNTGIYMRSTGTSAISWGSGGNLVFYGGGAGTTERMRIDASGNLLVGTASTAYENSNGTAISVAQGYVIQNHVLGTGTGTKYTYFSYNAGEIGSITQNGTTAVLYNTTSDQRLKENIADADDAGSKIDAIQVRKFDWKADGSHQDYGMVAQELLEVAPEAVAVPEDPEDMMGVDYSKLVPMMLKEIQSLRARIAALES